MRVRSAQLLPTASLLTFLVACGSTVEAPQRVDPLREEVPVAEAVPEVPVDAGVDAPEPDAPDAALSFTNYVRANPSASTSIGGPSSGSLRGGVPLPERTPGLLSNVRRPNATAFYATAEVIDALVVAARLVEEEEPGGTLVVSDIGFEQGGPIDHHGSHQAGRDVDVLFYLQSPEGAPIASVGAPIDPNGEGTDYRDLLDPADDIPLRIDLSRTWRFIEALLTPRDNEVQRMFIVEHLRTMLLQEAARQRAPRAVIRRFEEVTCQPSYAHDDHLHIRFFCSAEDIALGCADGNPMYPWRNAQLAEAGVDAVMEQRPRRRRSRVVTEEEVRANAPPMHASVRTFLDWRETWTTQPHPGRVYCR